MRNTIRRILKEAAEHNLKSRLKEIGPLKAKDIGIDPNLFVHIVFDDELTDYVEYVVPEMTQLTPKNLSIDSKKYEYRGSSPIFNKLLKKGKTVFTVGPKGGIGLNHEIYIHLEKYMTLRMIVNFIKEYYQTGESSFRLFTFRP